MEGNYQNLGVGLILLLIGIYAVLDIRAGLYVEIGSAIFILIGIIFTLAGIKNLRYVFKDIREMFG